MENGRIIIDPHNFNIHGTPGPGLGSIGPGYGLDSADDETVSGVHNVIYQATSHTFGDYQNALRRHEKVRKKDLPGSCKSSSYQLLEIMSDISTSQDVEFKATIALHPGCTWLLPIFQDMG